MTLGLWAGALGTFSGLAFESAAVFPMTPSKALAAVGAPQDCWPFTFRAPAALQSALHINFRRENDFVIFIESSYPLDVGLAAQSEINLIIETLTCYILSLQRLTMLRRSLVFIASCTFRCRRVRADGFHHRKDHRCQRRRRARGRRLHQVGGHQRCGIR